MSDDRQSESVTAPPPAPAPEAPPEWAIMAAHAAFLLPKEARVNEAARLIHAAWLASEEARKLADCEAEHPLEPYWLNMQARVERLEKALLDVEATCADNPCQPCEFAYRIARAALARPEQESERVAEPSEEVK